MALAQSIQSDVDRRDYKNARITLQSEAAKCYFNPDDLISVLNSLNQHSDSTKEREFYVFLEKYIIRAKKRKNGRERRKRRHEMEFINGLTYDELTSGLL